MQKKIIDSALFISKMRFESVVPIATQKWCNCDQPIKICSPRSRESAQTTFAKIKQPGVWEMLGAAYPIKSKFLKAS